MRKIFIASTDALRRSLEELGAPVAVTFADLDGTDLSEAELITVAPGAVAKAMAEQLVARGVSNTRLSYIDLSTKDDLADRVARPKHFYWDDVVPLSELECDEGELVTYKSGVGFLDKNLGWGWRLPELGVVAGSYGSGKSTFGQWLGTTFVDGPGRQLDAQALFCSWEDIGQEVRSNIRRYQHFSDGKKDLLDRIHFVVRDPGEDRLIDWYKDLVRYHRARYNTRYFLLDPWNEMDHVRDARQTETDYVRDVMKGLRRLVDELKIVLYVATHVPAKITKGNGEIEPFKIAHAFGSSQFGNKADRGLCILRAKKWEQESGHTILRQDKAKIESIMGKKATVALRFDRDRFRYEYDAYVTGQVQDVWKD